MDAEIWKKVVGDNRYSVSNLGRVRRDAAAKGAQAGKIIKPTHDIRLAANGKTKAVRVNRTGFPTTTVHKLVMAAHVGPRPEGLEVCHIDGDATNNRLDNLRYGTNLSNKDDSRRHDTIGRKLCNAEATSIKLMANDPLIRRCVKLKEIAAAYGVNPGTVYRIRTGRSWSHIGQFSDDPRYEVDNV